MGTEGLQNSGIQYRRTANFLKHCVLAISQNSQKKPIIGRVQEFIISLLLLDLLCRKQIQIIMHRCYACSYLANEIIKCGRVDYSLYKRKYLTLSVVCTNTKFAKVYLYQIITFFGNIELLIGIDENKAFIL